MISKLSKIITNKLIQKYSIDEEDYDVYVYSIFMILSFLFFVILSCSLGVMLNCFSESLFFSLSFQLLRKYAGGYHAKTEKLCIVLTSFSSFISIVLMRLILYFEIYNHALILSIVFVGIMCVLVPIDTPENPLSKEEERYFRKISIFIILVMFLILIISFLLKIERIFVACCMSLVLEGVLLLAGKLKKQEWLSEKS